MTEYRDGAQIALGVAHGLAYLHQLRIAWFDCKPSNVLLDHTGTIAKIADVGLSRIVAGTRTETMLVRRSPLSMTMSHSNLHKCGSTGVLSQMCRRACPICAP